MSEERFVNIRRTLEANTQTAETMEPEICTFGNPTAFPSRLA
jgi:hypothetical protein